MISYDAKRIDNTLYNLRRELFEYLIEKPVVIFLHFDCLMYFELLCHNSEYTKAFISFMSGIELI
jgi:hypothetical protein